MPGIAWKTSQWDVLLVAGKAWPEAKNLEYKCKSLNAVKLAELRVIGLFEEIYQKMDSELGSWMKHDTFDKRTMPIVAVSLAKRTYHVSLAAFCYRLEFHTRPLFSITDT